MGRCHEKLKAKDKRIRQDALNETTLLPSSSSSDSSSTRNEARRRISRCRRLSRVDAAIAAAAYKTFYSRVMGRGDSHTALPNLPALFLSLCLFLSHALSLSAHYLALLSRYLVVGVRITINKL